MALEVERPRRPEGPGNLQAWARDTRYAAAARLAAERGGAPIATGHTADDQVETILYRLASSPSRRALLGMRPRDGSLVRPLLGFTRAQTTAYCEERGLAWRDDPTNEEPLLRPQPGPPRARCRRSPRSTRPPPRNVLRTAELLRDEAEVLDALVDAELDGSGGDAPRGAISLARLGELPPALRRLVVQRLADDAAGRPVAGAARHAEEVGGAAPRRLRCSTSAPASARSLERGVIRAERAERGHI